MEDKLQGRFTRIDQIQWSEQEAVTGWLKGMDFPVRLARQVFTRQLAFCILLVVIWTYSGKISLQSIRNGGKWKSFINHLNLMLPWLNHLLESFTI